MLGSTRRLGDADDNQAEDAPEDEGDAKDQEQQNDDEQHDKNGRCWQ